MSSIPYYLEYHDAANNSHKFYAGLGTKVLYGRVGADGTLKGYSSQKVTDMRYEKQKKGYKSAPMPQYVEDRLRVENETPVKMPRADMGWSDNSDIKWKKVKPVKVSANQGLLNWFSSLSRTE
jgi:predicted DNA-binding WGR domain protein